VLDGRNPLRTLISSGFLRGARQVLLAVLLALASRGEKTSMKTWFRFFRGRIDGRFA
jgi:hypothetical protein